MPTMTHRYPVSVHWQAAAPASARSPLPAPASRCRSPCRQSSAARRAKRTNPEELLTSAIAGCYSITLGIIADHRKLPLVGIETAAEGEVE